MKKLTIVIAMIALTLMFSTVAFGQNGKRTQRRVQGGSLADGKYTLSNLSPNARQQNQAARPDNFTLNGTGVAGSGALRSAKAQRQSRAASYPMKSAVR